MKKKILKKLRSRAGASLSYALLLFLVCAVLCSVILASATAAAGRMAKMAETDQRYYAVTSAAELLKDVFKEHPTVSVVKVEEKTETTTYTNGVPGTPEEGTPTTTVYLVADKKAAEIAESDLTNAITEDTASLPTIQQDAAKNLYYGTANAGYLLRGRNLDLTSNFYTVAGLSYDSLAVVISEDLKENGDLNFTIYNKYMKQGANSTVGNRYTLMLSFDADQSVLTDTKTENVSSAATDATHFTVTTKTTKTTITNLTWTLGGIQTE